MIGEQIFRLPDGRRLGYVELGDPNGFPLFVFHGTPGSRLSQTRDAPIAQVPGLKIITTDRPGYGLSDPQPKRTLLDWPDDVASLADHLGLDRFAVAGGSGGGPHAAACAYKLSGRISVAVLYSSPAPANFPGAAKGLSIGNLGSILISRYAPWLRRFLMKRYREVFLKNPEGYINALVSQMSLYDQRILQQPEVRERIKAEMREAYRQGVEGHIVDSQLVMTSKGWGFDLGKIAVPVHVWYGEQDRLVTKAMAQYLVETIPTAQAHFLPDKGHLLLEDPDIVREMIKPILESR